MIPVQCTEMEHSFKVHFSYDRTAVEHIKTIPGRRFRKDLGNAWLIPKTSQRALERFLEWARGEEPLKAIHHAYGDPLTIYPTRSKGEKPWKHQLAAFRYLWNRQASLLDLKPGSGKSRIFVDYVVNKPDVKRVLILCPKSFVQGWRAQFEKHGGSPIVCVCLDDTAGTVSQRVQGGLRTIEEAQRRNLVAVVVVNYDVCWRDEGGMADFLLDAQFDVVGYDEVQRLRGAQTRVSKFAHRLGASIPVRIGLSGTPFPETPMDPFGVCRALDASVFGTSFHRYESHYAVKGGYGNFKVLYYINQNELKAKIDTLRFTMEPEGYELPPEQDIVIPLIFPPKIQKLYKTLASDLYAKVETGEVTLANAATAFTQLQRLCSGALPIENVEGEKTLTPIHTLKQDALRDLLDSFPPTQSVVVVCRFHYDLSAVHKIATEVGRVSAEVSGRHGRPPAHIDGGVWVGSETVLAVQGSSGVEGLDLTRAHVMCYYSYTLELGKYEQARARIRRAGQSEPCTYYHLVVQSGIDQKIQVLLEKKQHVLKGLLAGERVNGNL